jgi:hypothetical protein
MHRRRRTRESAEKVDEDYSSPAYIALSALALLELHSLGYLVQSFFLEYENQWETGWFF